jgi:hypothetical protein
MNLRYLLLACLIFMFTLRASAQWYTAAAGETIFSLGHVDAGDVNLTDVLRFSPVFNYQQTLHKDFSPSVGFYTGLGLRNVGLITHTPEGYKIKERSYSLGLPLALKVGNMEKTLVAFGVEGELMFAWKRKVFVDDQKTKYYAWFSDNVNIFNPSVFLEVRFFKGQYIRAKYYLLDFLNYDEVKNLAIPTIPTTTFIPEYGKSSELFYISLGTVILKKPLEEEVPSDKARNNADGFFRTVSSKNSD